MICIFCRNQACRFETVRKKWSAISICSIQHAHIYVQVCTHTINRYAYTTIVRYFMLFTSYDIKDTGYHIHMHTFISRYEIPVVSLSLSLSFRVKPLTQGTKHHRKHVKTYYSFCPLLMYKEILCLTHIGVYTYCLHIVTIGLATNKTGILLDLC